MAGIGAFTLTGCREFPELERPNINLPSQYGQSQVSESVSLADAKWWQSFNDPSMNTLAELGLKQSLDIRKAVARIEQAQGVFEAAGYPLSGQVRVGEAKLNDGSDADRTVTGFARAEASWRLDLFGELENEKKSAEASLDAAFEDAEISRLTLLT